MHDRESLNLKEFDLTETIREVLKPFTVNPVYRQIIFKFDIQKSNYVMTGDEDQIKQVLVNVIKNACDAMSETVKKELIVNLNSDGHNFKIEITDTGNGIPKENQSKVFTPFFTTKSMGKEPGWDLQFLTV